MVRPLIAASVSSSSPASWCESVWMQTGTSYRSATVNAVSTTVGDPAVSSWILRPPEPISRFRSMAAGSDALPRPSSWTLSGNASHASSSRWKLWAGLTPRSETWPYPIPTMVVVPAERAAGIRLVVARWTWQSTMPGVAISPSPMIQPVLAPETTVMSSAMSGLPARPMLTIRPSLIPMFPLKMPSTGSRIRAPPTIRSSSLSRPARPDIWRPSRIVLPKPQRVSSPGEASSRSTSTSRLVSPSLTRSPTVGPYMRA